MDCEILHILHRRKVFLGKAAHELRCAVFDGGAFRVQARVRARRAEPAELARHEGSDVRLIAPIVEIARGQKRVHCLRRHFLRQHALRQHKAGAVRRGVPTAVGAELVKQAAVFQHFHQRVVRAVGVSDIGYAGRLAGRNAVLYEVGEILRAFMGLGVVLAVVGFAGAAVGVRVHQKGEVRVFRRGDEHAARRGDVSLDGLRDFLVGIGGDRFAAASPVVLHINEGDRLRPVVDRPRQHQKPELVDPRQRLELRGRQILARFGQLSAFHVRLRVGSVVVASQREIIEFPVPRQRDHSTARCEIFLAAVEPVVHRFLRDQFLEKLVFLLFAARQSFRFLFVRQRRIAEDVVAEACVVARLLAARRLRRTRRPHDRAPDVELHFRM